MGHKQVYVVEAAFGSLPSEALRNTPFYSRVRISLSAPSSHGPASLRGSDLPSPPVAPPMSGISLYRPRLFQGHREIIVDYTHAGPTEEHTPTLLFKDNSDDPVEATEVDKLEGVGFDAQEGDSYAVFQVSSPCPRVSECFLKFESSDGGQVVYSDVIDGLGQLAKPNTTSRITITKTGTLVGRPTLGIELVNRGNEASCDFILMTDMDSGDVATSTELGLVATKGLVEDYNRVYLAIPDGLSCPSEFLCFIKLQTTNGILYSDIIDGIGRLARPTNESLVTITGSAVEPGFEKHVVYVNYLNEGPETMYNITFLAGRDADDVSNASLYGGPWPHLVLESPKSALYLEKPTLYCRHLYHCFLRLEPSAGGVPVYAKLPGLPNHTPQPSPGPSPARRTFPDSLSVGRMISLVLVALVALTVT